MESNDRVPLLERLAKSAQSQNAAFHTPGHKRGQGSFHAFRALIGDRALQADLPELPELDNLFAPQGAIDEAQTLAAETFGAEQTWFLINGSTCGIIAAILAACDPGDKILMPRNVHQSAISGLILSGAVPVFLQPDYDPVLDLAHSVAPETVAIA
ncbi:MAG TPA: aminotransferase class I/II-fold pyridoxal phosphate-dependent enzyme, partial [Leptolyngbya sp.]|nr:aminotransferase class I/II-fold pyridoxal phosphate-dependent enzyme [Leptolyngbya sp.]